MKPNQKSITSNMTIKQATTKERNTLNETRILTLKSAAAAAGAGATGAGAGAGDAESLERGVCFYFLLYHFLHVYLAIYVPLSPLSHYPS
jgi:hypothetical protein